MLFQIFQTPGWSQKKNGKTNFSSYGPKDFAEKGIFGISQGTRVLGPPIGWICLMA